LGSMVQNGKFALCALALDKQLNRVDLPTLGSPTMPHFKAIAIEVFSEWRRYAERDNWFSHFLNNSEAIRSFCGSFTHDFNPLYR